jgi:hypothetical protein
MHNNFRNTVWLDDLLDVLITSRWEARWGVHAKRSRCLRTGEAQPYRLTPDLISVILTADSTNSGSEDTP